MHNPTVPMTPEALPQQRLVVVRDLPARPAGLQFHGENLPRPAALLRASYPRNGLFLCQTEWAWSPMNNSIEAFYLNGRSRHWCLWLRFFDDDNFPWRWRWYFLGWSPRRQSHDPRAVAFHLMIDYWSEQRDEQGLDHFHWVNETGEFDTADLGAIGRTVWEETA